MIDFQGPDWVLNNVNAVLFDKDGTIIDSHIYWGEIIQKRSRALIRHFNLAEKFHNEICLVMGYSLQEKRLLTNGPIALVGRKEVIVILATFLKSIGLIVTEKELSDTFIEVHKAFLKNIYEYIKLLPGVEELLIELKNKNIKMALITSDSTVNAEAIINYLELQDYFDLIVGMEFVKDSKVSGIPAINSCKFLEIRPEDTICIGDAPMDVLMAKNANLKGCIGIALGQTPFTELKKITEFAVRNYNELVIK